jgi:AcrR family transcriptional regulator
MSQSPSAEVLSDGRKARGQASRRKLVAAMIALVKEGSVAPTAEQVAGRAAVGLRTVFRHFADMESLYREISTEVMQLITPQLNTPFKAADWRGRLDEMIERRSRLFEAVLPFRIATETLRHSSPTLQQNQVLLVQLQDQLLRRVLPETLQQDVAVFGALNLALSIGTWQQLRLEQQLDQATARRVMTLLVRGLIAEQAQ